MAVIERFKDALDSGTISDAHDLEVQISAQMKYDYLAAVHTMEQLEKLAREIENRRNYRTKLKTELMKNCCQSLRKAGEDEASITIKKLDATIKMMIECRNEIAKIESLERETDRLAKVIRDGVSAGT